MYTVCTNLYLSFLCSSLQSSYSVAQRKVSVLVAKCYNKRCKYYYTLTLDAMTHIVIKPQKIIILGTPEKFRWLPLALSPGHNNNWITPRSCTHLVQISLFLSRVKWASCWGTDRARVQNRSWGLNIHCAGGGHWGRCSWWCCYDILRGGWRVHSWRWNKWSRWWGNCSLACMRGVLSRGRGWCSQRGGRHRWCSRRRNSLHSHWNCMLGLLCWNSQSNLLSIIHIQFTIFRENICIIILRQKV